MSTAYASKFKQLILYAAQQHAVAPYFGKVLLAKVLFWSDFECFAKTGRSITGLSYEKLPNGPVPENYDSVLNFMQREGELSLMPEQAGAYTQYRPVALVEPDLSLFSDTEREIIDRVISQHQTMTAGEASAYSHGTIGWQVARPRERIPIGTALIVEPPPDLTEEDYEIARQIEAELGGL